MPKADMPIAALTPGTVLTAHAAVVCMSGYSSRVRDVSESTKDAVYARYHVVHVPYAHEVDHLVSLELGGSNAITNLWPEPYAGRWGARTKDVLENRLHQLVCDGTLSLAHAQQIEAANWVAAYRRYVGTQPPAPAVSHPPRHHKAPTKPASKPAHTSSGSCEPGYSPCLPIADDLNCSDVDGPVTVTGDDPYRLDADGDGTGCDS